MNYVAKTQQTDAVAGWPKGVTRYYSYADNLTCQQGDALFNALSPAEQLAYSDLVEPTPPNGQKKQVRSCGAGSTDSEVFVDADSADFEGSGSTTPTQPSTQYSFSAVMTPQSYQQGSGQVSMASQNGFARLSSTYQPRSGQVLYYAVEGFHTTDLTGLLQQPGSTTQIEIFSAPAGLSDWEQINKAENYLGTAYIVYQSN